MMRDRNAIIGNVAKVVVEARLASDIVTLVEKLSPDSANEHWRQLNGEVGKKPRDQAETTTTQLRRLLDCAWSHDDVDRWIGYIETRRGRKNSFWNDDNQSIVKPLLAWLQAWKDHDPRPPFVAWIMEDTPTRGESEARVWRAQLEAHLGDLAGLRLQVLRLALEGIVREALVQARKEGDDAVSQTD
jgi:hypothetical protein